MQQHLSNRIASVRPVKVKKIIYLQAKYLKIIFFSYFILLFLNVTGLS